jgi:hypothetical protein
MFVSQWTDCNYVVFVSGGASAGQRRSLTDMSRRGSKVFVFVFFCGTWEEQNSKCIFIC